MMTARIFTEPTDGHWSAWFEHAPGTAFGGQTAAEAVLRLLESAGLAPEDVEADCDASRGDRQALLVRRRDPCPDCGGGGRYIGLAVVEPCRSCGGTGVEIPF